MQALSQPLSVDASIGIGTASIGIGTASIGIGTASIGIGTSAGASAGTNVSVFSWWDQIPTDEGGNALYATKTELGKRKLKPVGSPVATISYNVRRDTRCYDLYAVADAVPKRQSSEAARAKAVANLEAIRLRERACKTCGAVKDHADMLEYGECWKCFTEEEDREYAAMV